ncbi:MAG: hypothetical protein HYY41_04420 [Chloroflexi bacterium]|nr:hypothetical protein [Chloroflexota bacterium]
MPAVEIHVKNSLARTGKGYQEVHEWVDKDETKKVERHDIKQLLDNAEHIKSMWGQEAAREFVIHLHDDIKARITRVQEEYAKQMAEALAYFGIK